MPVPRGFARKILAIFLSATLIPWQPVLLLAEEGAAETASTQKKPPSPPDPEHSETPDPDRTAPAPEAAPADWASVSQTVRTAFAAATKWVLEAVEADGKLAETLAALKRSLEERAKSDEDAKEAAEAALGVDSIGTVLEVKKNQTEIAADLKKLTEFSENPSRSWDAEDWKRFDAEWKSIEDRLAKTSTLLQREKNRAGLDSLSAGVLPAGFAKTHGALVERLGADYAGLVDSAKPLLERSLQSPQSESGKTAKALMNKVRAQLSGTSIGDERLAMVERNLAASLGSNGGPPIDGVIDQIGDLYTQAGVKRADLPFTLGELKDSARTQQVRSAAMVNFTDAAKLWRPAQALDRPAPGIGDIPSRTPREAAKDAEPAASMVERAKALSGKIPAAWRGKTLEQLEAAGAAIGDLFPAADRDALALALGAIKTQTGAALISDRVGALAAALERRESAEREASAPARFEAIGKSVDAFEADLSGLLRDPAFLKDPNAKETFRGQLDKLLARVSGDDSEWTKLLQRSEALSSPPLPAEELAAMRAKIAEVKPLVEFLQSLKANPRLKLTAMNPEIYSEFVKTGKDGKLELGAAGEAFRATHALEAEKSRAVRERIGALAGLMKGTPDGDLGTALAAFFDNNKDLAGTELAAVYGAWSALRERSAREPGSAEIADAERKLRANFKEYVVRMEAGLREDGSTGVRTERVLERGYKGVSDSLYAHLDGRGADPAVSGDPAVKAFLAEYRKLRDDPSADIDREMALAQLAKRALNALPERKQYLEFVNSEGAWSAALGKLDPAALESADAALAAISREEAELNARLASLRARRASPPKPDPIAGKTQFVGFEELRRAAGTPGAAALMGKSLVEIDAATLEALRSRYPSRLEDLAWIQDLYAENSGDGRVGDLRVDGSRSLPVDPEGKVATFFTADGRFVRLSLESVLAIEKDRPGLGAALTRGMDPLRLAEASGDPLRVAEVRRTMLARGLETAGTREIALDIGGGRKMLVPADQVRALVESNPTVAAYLLSSDGVRFDQSALMLAAFGSGDRPKVEQAFDLSRALMTRPVSSRTRPEGTVPVFGAGRDPQVLDALATLRGRVQKTVILTDGASGGPIVVRVDEGTGELGLGANPGLVLTRPEDERTLFVPGTETRFGTPIRVEKVGDRTIVDPRVLQVLLSKQGDGLAVADLRSLKGRWNANDDPQVLINALDSSFAGNDSRRILLPNARNGGVLWAGNPPRGAELLAGLVPFQDRALGAANPFLVPDRTRPAVFSFGAESWGPRLVSGSSRLRPQYEVVDYEKKEGAIADQLTALKERRERVEREKKEIRDARAAFGRMLGTDGKPGDVDHFLRSQDKAEVMRWVAAAYQQGTQTGRDPAQLSELREKGIRYYHGVAPDAALPNEVKQLQTLAATVPPAGSDNAEAWLSASAKRLSDVRNPMVLTEGGAKRFLDLRARRSRGEILSAEQLAFLGAWEGEGSYTQHLKAGLAELERGTVDLPARIAEQRRNAAFARTLTGEPPAGFFEALAFTPEQESAFRENLRKMRAAPEGDPNAAAFRAGVRESVAVPIESWLSSTEVYLERAPGDAARIRETLAGLSGNKDAPPPDAARILGALKSAGYTVYDEATLREQYAADPAALKASLAAIAGQQREHRLNQLLFNAVAEDENRLAKVFSPANRTRMTRDGGNPVLGAIASAYERREKASGAWTAFSMDPANQRAARGFAGVQAAETELLNATGAAMKDFSALDRDKRYYFWQRESDRNDAWFSHHQSQTGANRVIAGLGAEQKGERLSGLRLEDFDGGTTQFTGADSAGRQVIQQTAQAKISVEGTAYTILLDPGSGARVLTDAKGGRFVVGADGKLSAWSGNAAGLVEQFEFTEHATDASGDLKLRQVATYRQNGARREKARATLRDGMELLTRTLYGDGSIDITDVSGGTHVAVDTKKDAYTTTFLERGESGSLGRDRSFRVEKGDYYAGRYFATDKYSVREDKLFHERNLGDRVWGVFEQTRGGSGTVDASTRAKLERGVDVERLGFQDVREPDNYSYDLKGWEDLSDAERLTEARAMSARTAAIGRLASDTKDLMTGYILRNANKDETDSTGRKIDPNRYNVAISFTLGGEEGPAFRSDYFGVRDAAGNAVEPRWMFSTNGRFLSKEKTLDRSGVGEFFFGDDYRYQQQIMTTPSSTSQGDASDVRRAQELGDRASDDLKRRAKRYDPKKWRESELEMSKVISDVLQSHYNRGNGMLVSKQFGKFGDAEVVGVIAGETKYLRVETDRNARGMINLTKARFLYDDENQVPVYEYYSAGMAGVVTVDTGRKQAWSRRLPDRYVFESDIIEDTGYYWEDWARANPGVARGVAWAAAPVPMGIAALTGHSPSDEQLAAIYGGAAKGFVRFAPEVVTVLIPFGAAVKAVKWGLTAVNMARTARVAVTAIHVTFGAMMVPGLYHAGEKMVEAARTGDPDAIKAAVDEGVYWSLMIGATPKIFKMADGLGGARAPLVEGPVAPRAPPAAPKGFGGTLKGAILKPFSAIAESVRASKAAEAGPKRPGLAARGDALAESLGESFAQTHAGKITGVLDQWMYLPEATARGVGNLGNRDWRGRRIEPKFDSKGDLVNPSRIGSALTGFADRYGALAHRLVDPKKPPLVQNSVELRNALRDAGIDANAPAAKGLPTFTTARLYSILDPVTGERGPLSARPPKAGAGAKVLELDIFWRNGTKNFEVSNMNLGGAKLDAAAQLRLSASLLQWRGPQRLTSYELLGHAHEKLALEPKANRATMEILYDANTGQAVKIVEPGAAPEGARGANFRRTSVDVVFKDGIPELAFRGEKPPPFFEAMKTDLAVRQQAYRQGLGGPYEVFGASPKALAEYAVERARAQEAGAPKVVPDVVEGNFCHLSGTAGKLNGPALASQRRALLESLGRDPNGKVSTYDLIQVVEAEMGPKLGKAMTQKILENGLEPNELTMVTRMIETRINKVSKDGVTFRTEAVESALSSPEAFAKAAPEGALTVGLVSPDGPHVVTVRGLVQGKNGPEVVFEDPVTPGRTITLSRASFFELARLDAFRLQAGKGEAPAWRSRATEYSKDLSAFRDAMKTSLARDGLLGKEAYDALPPQARDAGFGAGWFGRRGVRPESPLPAVEPVRGNGGFQRNYFELGGPKAPALTPGQLQNLRPLKVSSAHSNVYLAEMVVDGKPREVIVKDNAVPNEVPTNLKAAETARTLREQGAWPDNVRIPEVYGAERWGPGTRAGLKSDAIAPERAAELAAGEKFVMVQEKIPSDFVSVFDVVNGKAKIGTIAEKDWEGLVSAVRALNERGVGHNDFANGTNIMLRQVGGRTEFALIDFGQGTHTGVKARLQYDGNQVLGRLRELEAKGFIDGKIPPPKMEGFGAGNPAMEAISAFRRAAEVQGREAPRGAGIPPVESLFGKIPGLEKAQLKGSTENGISGDTVQIEIGGRPWFLKRVSKEIGGGGDQAIRAMSAETRALNEAGMAAVLRGDPLLSRSFKVTDQVHVFRNGEHTFVLTEGVAAAPTMKTAGNGMNPTERADAAIVQLVLGLGDMNRGNVLKGKDGYALIDFEKISRDPVQRSSLQQIDTEVMLKNFPLVDRLSRNDPAVYRARFEAWKRDYDAGGRGRMDAALERAGWSKADRMQYLESVDRNAANFLKEDGTGTLQPYLEYANGWFERIQTAKAEKARADALEAAKPKGLFAGLFGGRKGFGAAETPRQRWVEAAKPQLLAAAKERGVPPATLAKAVSAYLAEAFPKSEGVHPADVIPASALKGQIKIWFENGSLDRFLKDAEASPAAGKSAVASVPGAEIAGRAAPKDPAGPLGTLELRLHELGKAGEDAPAFQTVVDSVMGELGKWKASENAIPKIGQNAALLSQWQRKLGEPIKDAARETLADYNAKLPPAERLSPDQVITHGTTMEALMGVLFSGRMEATTRYQGLESAHVWGAKGLDSGAMYAASQGVKRGQPGVMLLIHNAKDPIRVEGGEILSRAPEAGRDIIGAVISDGTRTIKLDAAELRALDKASASWRENAKDAAYERGNMGPIDRWMQYRDYFDPMNEAKPNLGFGAGRSTQGREIVDANYRAFKTRFEQAALRPNDLVHFTDEAALARILASGKLLPSVDPARGANGPSNAVHGDGVYFAKGRENALYHLDKDGRATLHWTLRETGQVSNPVAIRVKPGSGLRVGRDGPDGVPVNGAAKLSASDLSLLYKRLAPEARAEMSLQQFGEYLSARRIGGVPLSSLERFDPAAGKWVPLEPVTSRIKRALGFGADGKENPLEAFELGRLAGEWTRGAKTVDPVAAPKPADLPLAGRPELNIFDAKLDAYAEKNRNLAVLRDAYREALARGDADAARLLASETKSIVGSGHYKAAETASLTAAFNAADAALARPAKGPGPYAAFNASAYRHVILGEFDPSGKLVTGGVHTKAAMDGYLAHSGVSPVRTQALPNGVRRVVLPREAFNGSQWRDMNRAVRSIPGYEPGGKTLFPESWDAARIASAIDAVKRTEHLNRTMTWGGKVYIAVVDGVRVRVQTDQHGSVQTAFPDWNQP